MQNQVGKCMETVLGILTQKGFIIGVLSAISKSALAIRKGDFSFVMFITDLIFTPIVGHAIWKIAMDSHIPEWQALILTIVISINTFLLIALLTSPKAFKVLLINVAAVFKIDIRELFDEDVNLKKEEEEEKEEGDGEKIETR